MKKKLKVFCLNSMFQRKKNLGIILPNILQQADIVHVNLINYNNKIQLPRILNNKKIKINKLIGVGSETRFLYYNDYDNVYYFTIDDDILYPKDYSSRMINLMLEYNNEIVSTVHGAIPNFLKNDYYYKKRLVYSFPKGLKNNKRVLTAGVGTSCFNTSTTKIDINQYNIKNLSDVYTSVLLYNQNIPIICIKRPKGWLKSLNEYGTKIWETQPLDKVNEIFDNSFKKNGKLEKDVENLIRKFFENEL